MQKSELYAHINKLAVAYVKIHEAPKTEAEWDDAITELGTQLPVYLETSKVKYETVIENVIDQDDGTLKPVHKTIEKPVLETFDAFSLRNRDLIRQKLEHAYIDKPVEKLEIPRKSDTRQFLNALKYLFPNVVDVRQTVASVMKWRNAFNEPDAQYCLYLYSPKSGGTGKTFLTKQLAKYVRNIGGVAKQVTSLKGEFLNPKDYKANIVTIQDLNPNKIDVETLNNLIDRNDISYNIKFGPKGVFSHNAQLIITSNYKPQNMNSRRWAYVDYLSYNMCDQAADFEKLDAAVKNLFEACPDSQEYETLKKYLKTKPEAKNFGVLEFIAQHGPSAEDRLRASEFFAGEDKIMLDQCKNMFIDWKSTHVFPQAWGKTPFETFRFDFKKIARFIQEQGFLKEYDDNDADPLEQCGREWDALIEEICGGDDNNGNPNNLKCLPDISNGEDDFSDFTTTEELIAEKLTKFSDKFSEADIKDTNAQFCGNCVKADGSPIDLHTKKEECRPRIMTFESDTLSLEEQEANLKSECWDAKVFSGNKSLHIIKEIPEYISLKLNDIKNCDKFAVYHRLYALVAEMLFKDISELDMNCKSWLRKFRNPNGKRIVNGKLVTQTASFNDKFCSFPWDSMLTYAIECQIASEKKFKRVNLNSKIRSVAKNTKVLEYLNTSYTKKTGNGNSNSNLYRAIVICIAANDENTFNEVLLKARSEGWTEAELNYKIKYAKNYLNK